MLQENNGKGNLESTVVLRIYRKAWEKEQVILTQMLEQGIPAEVLSEKYGIGKEDIIGIQQYRSTATDRSEKEG